MQFYSVRVTQAMTYKIFKSIAELGPNSWDSFVSKRFFLSYNYLLTLEKACQQLEYRYVLVFDNDIFVSICYYQVIPFSGSALHQYLPSDNLLFRKLYDHTLAKVKTDLLVLGNVIFTCENGVLIKDEYRQYADAIVENSLEMVANSLKRRPLGTMISENIKNVSPKLFCPKQFYPFQVEDRMELNLSGFDSYEHYLKRLASKYRMRINKVSDLNSNVEVKNINHENFKLYRDQIERLFINVLDHSKFKLTTISVDYFYHFLLNIDRFKMKGYFLEDQLIGFMSFFELDTIIEVHYAGIDYEANQNTKIYNFMLIDMIRVALNAQIARICFGRTAQELKSTLGAEPYTTLSSLKINNSFLNIFTPLFLKRMIPEVWIQRKPFKK